MMKLKKTGFIVCFVFAAIFIAFGLYFALSGSSEWAMGIAMVVVGVIFVLCGIAFLVSALLVCKRGRLAKATLEERGMGDAIYMLGSCGERGADKKALAKTVGSGLIGAICAFFFGFGAFQIYSGAKRSEFVLGRDGLWFGDPKVNPFSIDGMSYISGFELAQFQVGGNKSAVTLTRGEEEIVLYVRDSGTTQEAVRQKIQAVQQAATGDYGANMSGAPTDDPFQL